MEQQNQPLSKESFKPATASSDKKEKDFQYLLENNSEQKLIEEIKRVSPGLSTGFKIGEIDLVIPGGAISIIAAPTSHGKTSVMINFLLGILDKYEDKSAYFFSYEESSAAIITSFINAYINDTLSINNRASIASYFREGSTKYMANGGNTELFESGKNFFFENLINTGRLRIHYSDMAAEDLIDAIYFIKAHDNVAIVCIDYMQLLKLKSSGRSRQEELKEICLQLKDCSVKTGLPILIAAQFNRTVTMEADLSPINIREAGDIEQIASLIIGMWNRQFVFSKDGNKDKLGNLVEKQPTIYLEVLKGRTLGNGHNSIMNFDGNIGKLTSQTTKSMFD